MTTNPRFAYGARHERGGIATYTIAYQRNDDTLEYSIVRCSPKDRFEKKIGREKAELRFTEGFSKIIPIENISEMFGESNDTYDSFYNFTHSELTDIIFADIMQREVNEGKGSIRVFGNPFMSLFERQEYLNELGEYA